MDRLATMTTFIKVVKYENFTAAAKDLGISRALVSRHISDLEAYLGVRLLHRTTRSVNPTPAGLQYMEVCESVLRHIATGEEELRANRSELAGDISILCPIWVGRFGISEATAEFAKQYPSIRLKLEFAEPSSNPHEFIDQGFDVCMQPVNLRDSSIMVRKIGQLNFVLVASPEYIGSQKEPQTIKDLTSHDWLRKLSDPGWIFKTGEKAPVGEAPRYSTNSVFALRSAAMAGIGIAMLPIPIAKEDINKGKLVEVLPQFPLEARPLYVAFPPGSNTPLRIRTLIDFLAEWFLKNDQNA